MAWTTPMTFVAGNQLTAAQLNQQLRDNLLETATAKAADAGSYFVATAANAIAQRTPGGQTTLGSTSTSSTSYSGTAPTVTRTCQTMALVLFSAQASNDNANYGSYASVAVSGATTVAANDDWCLTVDGQPASQPMRVAMAHLFTGLNAGSHTFTMQYKRGGAGTATFTRRSLAVLSF